MFAKNYPWFVGKVGKGDFPIRKMTTKPLNVVHEGYPKKNLFLLLVIFITLIA